MTWTAQRLREWLQQSYDGAPIVALSNREPFRHDHAPDGSIVVRHSTSGLVTAVEPLMRACSGVWVAHGAGTADRIALNRRDGLDVPPANPQYRLRRVWLDAREERGYYQGFANEGLWPLCHRAHVRPIFRSEDFDTYWLANAKFAAAACEETNVDAPLFLVQDYHLALAPRMIRKRLPLATIVAFWHIPWPHPQDFEVCPWGRQLLIGLLGSSIAGFQTPSDCRSFVDTAEYFLKAQVNRERNRITYAGRETWIRAYPVSVEWPNPWTERSPDVQTCRREVSRWLALPAGVSLGVGVDRLDYTKGLEEKFLAIERLLDGYPEFRQRFVFVQLAQPTRDGVKVYRDLRARLVLTADRINRRFAAGAYQPIVLLEGDHAPETVYQFLRAADLCYVGSVHDGMNLVAKEFVSARDDERGVLVLSSFTGAARELSTALKVNPYAVEHSAQVLADALNMPENEQAERMREMRAVVASFNTYSWAARMLQDAALVSASPRARQPIGRSSRPARSSAAPGLRAAF